MDTRDEALLELLLRLDAQGYDFVTITPASHARVVARPDRQEAASIEDVLGWSLPFRPGAIDPPLESALRAAGALSACGEGWRASMRVSRLHGRLFLHSAYPTDSDDAVFLGPDSYRFADLIRAECPPCPAPSGRIVDIGAGAGVGAIVAAGACPDAELIMTDINPEALRLARINARAAGVEARFLESDGLYAIDGAIDLALANPPYIIDADGPTYRSGGDMHGGAVSLEMARAALARLAPGGRLILYTGSAIVRGRDRLREALAEAAGVAGASLRYHEIDPDVFGEELATAAYAEVDRIAVVAAVITRPA